MEQKQLSIRLNTRARMTDEMMVALCGFEGMCVGKGISTATAQMVRDYLAQQDGGDRLVKEFKPSMMVSSPKP